MEFWGVEVKPGQTLKVEPNEDSLIHLSQASLGESKKEKGNESVPLFVKFGGQKLVLGTLSHENHPQIPFDLVFEKEFELSHNWKNGSIYFCGYQTPLPDDSEEFDMGDSEDEEEEMELPAGLLENGKVAKAETAKPAAAKANAAAKPVAAKPNKDVKPKGTQDDSDSDDEDDSDEDGLGEDDSDEASDMEEDSDDEDDSDEDDSDEDEETPKKPEVGKKRPAESATKTPVSTKKAKPGTPSTEGKKGGHVATPHPSKQAGKTPGTKPQTPKSGGSQFSCGSCSKTFNSENGLQSHSKAKHGK